MNVLSKELKRNWKSLVVWCAFILFLSVVGVINYDSMASSGDEFQKMMDNMPPVLLSIAGIGSNMNVTKPDGFYAVMSIFSLYIFVFHAAFLGAKLVAKETEEHTAEFLYTKPVSRSRVLTQKLLAGILYCLALNLFTLAASFIAYRSLEGVSNLIPIFALCAFAVQLMYLFLGAACAAAIRSSGKATGGALAVALGTLFYSKALSFMGAGGFWWVLSPFLYFDPNRFLFGEGVEVTALFSTAIVLAGSIAVIFIAFNRKDIAI